MSPGAPSNASTRPIGDGSLLGWRCSAYGLEVRCAEPLPGFVSGAAAAPAPDLVVEIASDAALDAAFVGGGEAVWTTELAPQRPFRAVRDAAGALLFEYGDLARFALVAGGGRLLVAAAPGRDAEWQRVLLDSVLFCVALAGGRHALHAAAVAIGARGAAIVARTGGGKTSLAAELLLRGHRLIADDIVVLDAAPAGVMARPGPPLLNLPLALADRLADHVRCIAAFEDEQELWVSVDGAAERPVPLEHVVLLDRGAADTSIAPSPDALLPLLAGAVYLEDEPSSARERFELFSALARSASVWELRGAADASAGVLAELVERAVL